MKKQLFKFGDFVIRLFQYSCGFLIAGMVLGLFILIFGGRVILSYLPVSEQSHFSMPMAVTALMLAIIIFINFIDMGRLVRRLIGNFSDEQIFSVENSQLVLKLIWRIIAWTIVQLIWALISHLVGVEHVSDIFDFSLADYSLNALFFGIALVIWFILRKGQVIQTENDEFI